MQKADHTTPRHEIHDFQQICNVGPAFARDMAVLGMEHPSQLINRDPLEMYRDLSRLTGTRQDPCVLDVFIATTDYMNGNPPKNWWEFTEYRKQTYGDHFKDRDHVKN